jgi:hypothetical protein
LISSREWMRSQRKQDTQTEGSGSVMACQRRG